MKDKKKSSKWSLLLANAKHYRMERFITMFSLLVVALLVVSGACLRRDFVKKDTSIATKALYTKEFKTSKTDIPGKVIGVYTNDDKTRAFLLMHFSEVANISTDANQYKAFLTGADVAHNKRFIDGHPAGSIYMFGTSGYMGVYLVNKEGFKPQILDLTVRSLKKLKSDQTKNKAEDDPSFSKNDQFRVYFNPGGSDAPVIACLNEQSEPNVKDLFDQTVGVEGLKKVHELLYDDLNQMEIALTQIEEYARRLDQQDNIQLPDAPAFIAGDKIIRDDNGTKDDPSDDKYNINFVSMADGGYNVNWQGKSLADDLLSEAMRNDKATNLTIEQFFAKKVSERNRSVKNSLGTLSNIVWTMKDGTLLEALDTGSDTGRYATINNDVQSLMGAWRNYGKLKLQYQTVDLEKLVGLHAMSKVVSDSVSINTSDEVLRVY